MRQFIAEQQQIYVKISKKTIKEQSIYIYVQLSIYRQVEHTQKKENKLFSLWFLLLSSELNYFHSHQTKAQKSMLGIKLRVNPQTAR